MTMKTRIAAAGLLALSALGLATTAARADSHDGTDAAATAQAFAAATVTLPEAIAAAEADTGGKAMAVEFDAGENGEPAAFDVDVLMADGTMMEMVVNAADGTVAPDTDEAGDDTDEGDDEDGDEGDDEDGDEGDDEDGDEGEEGGEENEG